MATGGSVLPFGRGGDSDPSAQRASGSLGGELLFLQNSLHVSKWDAEVPLWLDAARFHAVNAADFEGGGTRMSDASAPQSTVGLSL